MLTHFPRPHSLFQKPTSALLPLPQPAPPGSLCSHRAAAGAEDMATPTVWCLPPAPAPLLASVQGAHQASFCLPATPPLSASQKALLLLLLSRFSRVRLCATPQTTAHQAPLSLGFSRQEHWSGLPFPSPMHARMLNHFSCVQLCATPWTAAHQALVVKNSPADARVIRDASSITGSERSPGEGHGNPLQYSCLENAKTEEPGGLWSMGSQRVGHD